MTAALFRVVSCSPKATISLPGTGSSPMTIAIQPSESTDPAPIWARTGVARSGTARVNSYGYWTCAAMGRRKKFFAGHAIFGFRRARGCGKSVDRRPGSNIDCGMCNRMSRSCGVARRNEVLVRIRRPHARTGRVVVHVRLLRFHVHTAFLFETAQRRVLTPFVRPAPRNGKAGKPRRFAEKCTTSPPARLLRAINSKATSSAGGSSGCGGRCGAGPARRRPKAGRLPSARTSPGPAGAGSG